MQGHLTAGFAGTGEHLLKPADAGLISVFF